VRSKLAALAFAQAQLGQRWAALVAETLAFPDWVVQRASNR
jgi:hypothetical protein